MDSELKPEQIDQLVFDYQEGNVEAGEKLLELFDPYIEKYVRMLVDGRINFKDKDSRNFIMLRIKDKDTRYRLSKRWQSAEVRRAAYESLAALQKSCSFNTREDIKQELVYIFLKLAKRYKAKGRSFSGYLYTIFRYEVHRALDTLTKDPLTYAWNTHTSYMDSEYVPEDGEETPVEYPSIEKLLSPIDDELGTNWIYGITTSDMFSKLSILDRLIIKMYYIDEYNDREIAEKTGFHINTINGRRRAVKKLLQELMRNARD